MQTFLPLPSFQQSAQVLDTKRLGNQRNEALVVYRTIHNPHAKAWKHHPCTRMWSAYSDALAMYYNEILNEWINRGFKNHMDFLPVHQNSLKFPQWIGNQDFHSSHRAALLYKEPRWYKQFGWTERPQLRYVWPIHDEQSTFKDAFGDLV